MSRKRQTVGIVDYGVGNHTSVLRCVRGGFRALISNRSEKLDEVDVLILPGVGAFPIAMQHLHDNGLASYLQKAAQMCRP